MHFFIYFCADEQENHNMINILKISKITLLASLLMFTLATSELYAQESSTTTSESVTIPKSQLRQQHRDSVRAHKKVWTSILGGPSYTPEASLGAAGAVLLSFKMDAADTVSQRSFLPVGFNLSINGTFVVAGAGTFFFNENRFRIYTSYGFRNEPANFYGVGMDEIDNTVRSDSTTLYHKASLSMYNRFVWEVKPDFYLGPIMDINYSKSTDLNEVMAANPYILKYDTKYTNVGLGAIIQYDTRDDVATPTDGVLLSAIGKIYGKYAGGSYNYQALDLEYRQFQHLFRRATLAWTARTQMSFGDVPFTELPSFGSPFDLRGFYWGQYRDKTMGYGIAEFRHMFGTEQDYANGRLLSKFGYVVWAGTGTLGNTPSDWNEWKTNYGVGLRVQIQPHKNFRLDIGKGQGQKGMLVYFNMTEAF